MNDILHILKEFTALDLIFICPALVIFFCSAIFAIFLIIFKQKNKRITCELEYTRKTYEILQQQQQHLSKLRQDISIRHNDIHSALEFACQCGFHGDYQQMSETILNLSTYTVKKTSECFCQNVLLNSLLQIKKSVAEENKILCKFQIILPDNFDQLLSDVDITSLFSNLLDNGLEASNCPFIPSDSRFLELKVNYQANVLFIEMKNSKNPDTLFQHRSTKRKNPLVHGYGLSIIESIVEKYHGNCQWIDEKIFFTCRLSLHFDESYTNEVQKL